MVSGEAVVRLLFGWFFHVPGSEPAVFGLGEAVGEEAPFHVWEVGGTVEDADSFGSLFELSREDLEAFVIAVGDDGVFTGESCSGLVTLVYQGHILDL